MKSEDELREELERIAPDFPQKIDLTPPDEYFQVFPDLVINRWKQDKPAVISPWKRIAAIAALLAGLLTGGYLLMKKTDMSNKEITSWEAYQYIHEHIDEFEGMIEAERLTEDIHQMNIQQHEIEEFLLEEMDDAEVEELF